MFLSFILQNTLVRIEMAFSSQISLCALRDFGVAMVIVVCVHQLTTVAVVLLSINNSASRFHSY